MAILFECKNISKSFGITRALADVDFELEKGEIHGLIGENGSGKSTLSNLIACIHHPDKGEMQFLTRPWKPATSLDAINGGVSMIIQETGTVPNLTVAHNIFMGRYDRFSRFGFINEKEMNRQADELLRKIGESGIHGGMPVRALNMQQRKIVEIAKAVSSDPQLLITDETTNVLSEEGREILFRLIHQFAGEGKAVLIISHDIDEVMAHCDRLTILRDGHITATLEKSEFDADIIKALMIGRELTGNFYRNDNDPYQEEVVLSLKNASSLRDVTNVSIDLHKGEILGIGGLADSGMHTVGKMFFGAERFARGEVSCRGKKFSTPSEAVGLGIAYLSKDRNVESLASEASLNDNIAITGLTENSLAGVVYAAGKEKRYVTRQIDNLKIKANSRFDRVSSLSGGNKQKAAFAKWFAKDSGIFIMDCPTRGIDIGVKQEIYRMMYDLKKQGKSILLIGEEMPELIGMSDRIIVMKDGRISDEFLRSDGLTEEKIVNSMF